MVSIDLWFGAATTLAGGLLGGSITLVVSRQQMRFAQIQRREVAQEESDRRSLDRRFQAYTEFLTRARTYRDSIRLSSEQPGPLLTAAQIDEYAQSVDTASAFVFLVTESSATYDACRSIMRALGEIQTRLHDLSAKHSVDQWSGLNAKMADALREFQVAARAELGVSGVEQQAILTQRAEAGEDS